VQEEEVNAPNICSLPTEEIRPVLDPNRALFRRVFFLNDDRNKYVSVAFNPAQGYTALVEFGTAKNANLRLTEQHFTKLTEHLPVYLWPYVLTSIIEQASKTIPR